MDIRTQTLANGLEVATISMPFAHSISLGIWVKAGARDELEGETGIAHFLEHMAFKGTSDRTAAQIASDIENVGGFMNAYTSREETAYFIRLLPDEVALGVDLLCDILTDSQLPAHEIERERGVIIQEIGQSADTPDDVVFEQFNAASYGRHTLGNSILGTTQSVSGFSRDDLGTFMDRYYGAGQMMFCAAGNLSHDRLVDMVAERLGTLKDATHPDRQAPVWQAGEQIDGRPLEQCHIVFGLSAPKASSAERYALFLLSNIYGGGMSSRLFQQVREERGLCYSIFSFSQLLSDNGVFGVYAGTSENQLDEMLTVSTAALADCTYSITDEELARAKQQLKAASLMRRDSVGGMMESTARQLILFGEVLDRDKLIADIDNVTKQQVMDAAANLLSGSQPSVALTGPHSSFQGHGWLADRLSG